MKGFAWVLLYKGWDTPEVSSLIQFISYLKNNYG